MNWQNDLTLDERNSLILGGDWYEDRINSSTPFDEDSRWNRAAFIQHHYQADSFSTELGLRRDQNQQFGGQNSWSGTFTLPLNPDNDVLLTYSEGFRAPTFNDLYYPDFSNPDLKPETSKSYELQWRSQLTDTSSPGSFAVSHGPGRRDYFRQQLTATERGLGADQRVRSGIETGTVRLAEQPRRGDHRPAGSRQRPHPGSSCTADLEPGSGSAVRSARARRQLASGEQQL